MIDYYLAVGKTDKKLHSSTGDGRIDRIKALAEELIAFGEDGRLATVSAANVEEAIHVAVQVRDLGKAQWFRGQIKNYPKLTPSI